MTTTRRQLGWVVVTVIATITGVSAVRAAASLFGGSDPNALVSTGNLLSVVERGQYRVRWATDGDDDIRVILIDDGDPGLAEHGVVARTHYPPNPDASGVWIHGLKVELPEDVVVIEKAVDGVKVKTMSEEEAEIWLEDQRNAVRRVHQ